MPLEPESYRDNLELIYNKYPQKTMLTKTEVQDITGLNYRTVCKLFEFKKGYISAAKLARAMS